jgi:hypothetical protein
MRVALIESSIGATPHKGHPEHFAAGFTESVKNSGVGVTILTHKNNLGRFSSNCEIIQALSHSAHERSFKDRFDGKLETFRHAEEALVVDFRAIQSRLLGVDMFLLPTATSKELAGVGRWLQETGVKAKIGAIFHWGGTATYSPGSLDAALLRQAARRVASSNPVGIWYAATHGELAAALEGPLGHPVRAPRSLTFFAGDPHPPGSAGKIRIGVLGGMRPEKGAGQLCTIADTLARLAPEAELVIQSHSFFGNSSLMDDLRRRPNVAFVQEWLGESEMNALCRSIDLAILPYNRRSYATTVSGIFTLLSGNGIPCAVPSNTWMSDKIDKAEAGGFVFDVSSGEDIGRFVAEVLPKIAEMSSVCRSRLAGWKSAYSADLVVEELLEFLSA